MKFLFVSFNKVLFSYSFNIADYTFSSWDSIQSSWEANQKANQQAIEELLRNGSLSVSSVGGRNLYSLNLAPTLESRDYLANGEQVWMYGIAATNALDSSSAMAGLSSNTYPYADPVLTEDGAIVVYLSDTGSEDVERTRVYFSTRNAGGAYAEGKAIDDAFSYGDSQLSLAGTGGFAVAAWTRQTESVGKSGGESVTNEDQMVMLNSADVYAAVYENGIWSTEALTSNATPDLAPVAATNGRQAIVAWRAVATSGEPTGEDGAYSGVTNFDERDTILYRVYNGSAWSEPYTLYNGTSGSVKAIEAAMLSDGTAAVVYTLDTDETDSTTADREIVYAVVNSGNNSGYAANDVIRNVRATKDSYLDENPQITAVKFGADENSERFVLGWYTEQSVSTDSAQVLDGGSQAADTTQTTSDIRLITFDNTGAAGQDLPDSISHLQLPLCQGRRDHRRPVHPVGGAGRRDRHLTV